MGLAVIVRTEDEEKDFVMSVAKKTLEEYDGYRSFYKDNDKRILENLVKERFPRLQHKASTIAY
jgi:hypothetical protein